MSALVHRLAAALKVDAAHRDRARSAWRRLIHWKPPYYREPTAWGLNTSLRKVRIVISLTSYPGRISTVHQTINTLLTQSEKPDRLVLWLAESQFPNREGDLPQSLLAQRSFGLEVRWCEDLRSFKKLLPALKAFPDAAIVTVDDDLFYHPDMLKELLVSYAADRESVHTQGAMRIARAADGTFLPYRRWRFSQELGCTMAAQLILGGSGTLYPPHLFDDEVFDRAKWERLVPRADDMWFWAMVLRAGRLVRLAHGGPLGCSTNYNADNAMALWNSNQQAEDGNDAQFAAVLEAYPEVFAAVSRCEG